jgi:cell wall-associated NlpC family hydrolase
MTGAQAHALGEKVKKSNAPARAAKVTVAPTGKSGWTPAMGTTAVNKAKAWQGLPYSWAGGVRSGPTTGVCNKADAGVFDCKVWGFDCSGLVLYSWGPYLKLDHYAATQYGQAGKFHPPVDSLQPGDLLFFSSNDTVAGIHHVQIYLGGGKVIEAPMSGYTVRIVKANFGGEYFGATRPASTRAQIAPPAVTRMSTQYSALAGGKDITVDGKNLGNVTSMSIGGLKVAFTKVSSTRVRAKIPAGVDGTVDVRLTNLWGTSARTDATELSYVSAKPQVFGLAKPSGSAKGGDIVAVYATGLGANPTITVDGKAATGLKQISPYKFTIVTPAHKAGRVAVRVTTGLGTSALDSRSTYTYVG